VEINAPWQGTTLEKDSFAQGEQLYRELAEGPSPSQLQTTSRKQPLCKEAIRYLYPSLWPVNRISVTWTKF